MTLTLRRLRIEITSCLQNSCSWVLSLSQSRAVSTTSDSQLTSRRIRCR